MRRPQVALLPDGRLHLQDGPIDLVIGIDAEAGDVLAARAAAIERFTGLLDELCDELAVLRQPAQPGCTALRGAVARRMHAAVAPFAGDVFITPMAAVAGSVAEEILGAMTRSADLARASVNNGGDIALHLSDGAAFTVGIVARPDRPQLDGTTRITAADRVRGIATSGRHGRSFSLGIADAVTVLAATAAAADAAATVIANAVDLPDHGAITRVPANSLQPDSDLGARPVTRAVGPLAPREVAAALEAGRNVAEGLRRRGLIAGAALHLAGEAITVGLPGLETPAAATTMALSRDSVPVHHG